MSVLRKFPLPLLGTFCLSVASLLAHAAPSQIAARDLVVASVDAGQRTAIADRAAWATAARDRGAVAGDLPLSHLTLTLNRTPERQAAFDQFVAEQQNPASPHYHQWLTAEQIGERYGASQHDIDAVTGWLAAQGLSVDRVSPGRTRIVFSGTAATVSSAFATPLHWYAVSGAQRIANTGNPQIPAALAGAVQGVRGLYTVKYQPQHRIVKAAPTGNAIHPQVTANAGNYYLGPGDFAKIYDIPAGVTGSGQSIAIIGRSRVYLPDIEAFQKMFGQAVKDPTIIIPPNGADPGAAASTCTATDANGNCTDDDGDQSEASLDVEWATGLAPGATIKLIASGGSATVDGVDVALDYAIDTTPLPANIVSTSFGSCESQLGQQGASQYDQLFEQAAAEGISVLVASGDAGVAGCESLDDAPTANAVASINALCSSGYVTCVGGTEFAASTDTAKYWSSGNSAGYVSALGYIPEGAWNEPTDGNGDTQYSSSGGGPSQYIAMPSWQSGQTPGTQGRYTPDVAFNAAGKNGYIVCMAAQSASCVATGNQSGPFMMVGGTSASTPSMAAVAAMLNQKIGAAQGHLNPRLYALATNNASNGVFHDVTVATSGVSDCAPATPSLCNNSTPGPNDLTGGLAGYTIGTGYDQVTGLGSIDVAHLLNDWGSSTGGGSTGDASLDAYTLSGLWYDDKNYDGSGFNFVMSSVGLLVTYYGWDAQGHRLWLTASSGVSSFTPGTPVTISLLQNTSGSFLAPGTAKTIWGTLTLDFSSCTAATATLSGADGTVAQNLSRLVGASGVTGCGGSFGNGAANGAAINANALSGLWYDSKNYSGSGFNFVMSSVGLLVTYYGWDAQGRRLWLTASSGVSSFTPGTPVTISLLQNTSGSFLAPGTGKTTWGTLTLNFSSCTSATATLSGADGTVSQNLVQLVEILGIAGC